MRRPALAPELSIVVPTRDKASRLRLALGALAVAAAGVPAEVIVINDAGVDEATAQAATDAVAGTLPLHYLLLPARGGRAAARNAGAREARAGRVLFLDDDIVVDRAVLANHLSPRAGPRTVVSQAVLHLPWIRMLDDPTRPPLGGPPVLAERIAALGAFRYAELAPHARMLAFEGDLRRLMAARREEATGRWLACTGGCLSVACPLFEEVGGFDEDFGSNWGVEDLEFGLRAERAGGRIERPSAPAALHLDHPAVDRSDGQAGNLALFASRHGAVLGERLRRYFEGTLDILEVSRDEAA